MMKISYHALGLSEMFNEMHTQCEMKKIAALTNKDMCVELKDMFDMVLPKDNVLDMGIYTRNRPVRTIRSQKDMKSGGFQLSEESKHLYLSNCFVTKILSDEQKEDPNTYSKLPSEFEAEKVSLVRLRENLRGNLQENLQEKIAGLSRLT